MVRPGGDKVQAILTIFAGIFAVAHPPSPGFGQNPVKGNAPPVRDSHTFMCESCIRHLHTFTAPARWRFIAARFRDLHSDLNNAKERSII